MYNKLGISLAGTFTRRVATPGEAKSRFPALASDIALWQPATPHVGVKIVSGASHGVLLDELDAWELLEFEFEFADSYSPGFSSEPGHPVRARTTPADAAHEAAYGKRSGMSCAGRLIMPTYS
jgi:hypothetical protein